MSTLTFGQLEQLLEARGATPQQADVGAAIAEAESGGRTDAHGDVSFGQGGGQYVGSLGPWQIFGQAHPKVSASCAQDPNCAADQVKLISNGFTNWNPWTTFKTGAYRQYLNVPSDFVPPGSVPSAGAPTSGVQLLASTPGVPGWAAALGEGDLGDLFLRGGLVVVGLILILVGLITMFRAGPALRYYGGRAAMGAVMA